MWRFSVKRTKQLFCFVRFPRVVACIGFENTFFDRRVVGFPEHR
jgi:hypothetical protein